MHDLLNDIIDMIIAQGLAKAKDVDIFKDFAPAKPDDIISIYEYAGTAPAVFTTTSVRSVQVCVRAKTNANGKKLCWDIYKAMYREDSLIDLGGKRCIIAMRNTPLKIDVDDKNRPLYAFNCAITTNFD